MAESERFADRRRVGDDKQVLDGDLAARVLAAGEEVDGEAGEVSGLLVYQVGEVLIERHFCRGGAGAGKGEGSGQQGVGTEFGFIGGVVEADEELVEFFLIERFAGEGGGDEAVDVGDGFAAAKAGVAGGIAVAKLVCFVAAGGSARRDGGGGSCAVLEFAGGGNGGPAAGVEDFQGGEGGDGGHGVGVLKKLLDGQAL